VKKTLHPSFRVSDLTASLELAHHPDGVPVRRGTAFSHLPDGFRIELVQWPPGHADGLTAADFDPSTSG